MRDSDRTIKESGAIILAGGESKRLGSPKALLEINGKTLLRRMVDLLEPLFQQITVVTDRPDYCADLPVLVTSDIINYSPKGPLRGIHAGLLKSDYKYQFVVACDMPFLNPALIRYMASYASGYDAVVPRIGSYYQPLHAFYSRKCACLIEKNINAGYYKVTEFYRQVNIRYIGPDEIHCFDPLERSFININTWEDYEMACLSLERID